ncbi:MAG: preprotein translocase subunit YajC [Clostridia bacterium]|nr:preprotein translocase subunit YajC [Clostridia bacterium]
MNLSLLTLAAETTSNASTTGTSGTSMLVMVGWVAIMLVAMYFLMIRPQRKKQKEEKKMRENLQVGDEVVTIGGIYGRVISLKEDSMVIESKSDHSKLSIARWALQQNLTVHDDTPKK